MNVNCQSNYSKLNLGIFHICGSCNGDGVEVCEIDGSMYKSTRGDRRTLDFDGDFCTCQLYLYVLSSLSLLLARKMFEFGLHGFHD